MQVHAVVPYDGATFSALAPFGFFLQRFDGRLLRNCLLLFSNGQHPLAGFLLFSLSCSPLRFQRVSRKHFNRNLFRFKDLRAHVRMRLREVLSKSVFSDRYTAGWAGSQQFSEFYVSDVDRFCFIYANAASICICVMLGNVPMEVILSNIYTALLAPDKGPGNKGIAGAWEKIGFHGNISQFWSAQSQQLNDKNSRPTMKGVPVQNGNGCSTVSYHQQKYQY